MKIIAIGDIHGKDIWNQVRDFDCDKIIFLGDYVDSFDVEDGTMTTNLMSIIDFKKENPEKVELLLGNHDIQYYYNANDYGCSGFRPAMWQVWNNLFTENRKLFNVAYQYKKFLFTHAGLSKGWITEAGPALNAVEGETLADKLNRLNARESGRGILFRVGRRRGGWHQWGGIVWADITETERNPLDHYHQIVGHSRVKEPFRYDFGTGSMTYIDCLDQVQRRPEGHKDETLGDHLDRVLGKKDREPEDVPQFLQIEIDGSNVQYTMLGPTGKHLPLKHV